MNSSTALAAYLARIGHSGRCEPTVALLTDLHLLHPKAIAFEALDPFLGHPVDICPAAIHRKLVARRRGGYCQEHNGLFCDMLAALGFNVVPLGARVVWMAPDHGTPLTHRITLVDLPEGRFIADVGFGAQTPTAPLRLEPGLEQPTPHGFYRIMRNDAVFEVQIQLPDRWAPMYRFTLERQNLRDFQMANWFTSTYPHARFVRNLVASRVLETGRASLVNREFSIVRAGKGPDQRQLESAADLQHVLEEVIGLELPVDPGAIWGKLECM